MSVNICKIAIILALLCSTYGGCDVNDWPHSCLANFRIGKQRCEPCESGRYGCNCTESCPDNTYGPGCYTFCNCPEDEFCDPKVGCIKYTHTTQQATDKANRSTTAKKDINSTTLQNTDTRVTYIHNSQRPTDDGMAYIHTSQQTTDDVNKDPWNKTTSPVLRSDVYQMFNIIGISMATSLPLVFISIFLFFLAFIRRKTSRPPDENYCIKSVCDSVIETNT